MEIVENDPEQKCECCGWVGTIQEALENVKGWGEPICPKCSAKV